MRRLGLSIAAGCLFSWFGFHFVWSFGEQFPLWLQRAIYLFWPGILFTQALERFVDLQTSETLEVGGWLLIYAINALFWAAIFYGLSTLYARRHQRLGKGPVPRSLTWSLMGLCVVLAVSSFVYTSWTQRTRESVVFVVPDGFTGYQIELIEDPDNGIEVALVDGSWVFDVPASGSLRIQSREMLMLSHTESCRFESGGPCTVEGTGTWWEDGGHAVDRWRFVD